ncbi:MAG TPA: 8-amino-7-oxononanoate synthase [Thiotrichales bacterium]|nr:8-amino-7-oxononanoate synthase [Thiotrichales bacterium]
MKDLRQRLAERKQQHRYRARRISDSAQQVDMRIDGVDVTSFCSNDYLGFANHPALKQAAIEGVKRYGVGSGAAHLINGHNRAHHQLEDELAAFTGYPRALLFSTGYMANLGLCQAWLDKSDAVFEDRLNHASLIDAALLSGARFQRYRHNDAGSLQRKIDALKNPATGKLVLTDAVFSMDGDIADLPALSDVCRQSDSLLMIDDAHGFGVLGENGAGSRHHFGLDTQAIPVYMATLGKALGSAGAFIAGSEELIETLIQQARTYIYTTAMPPAIAEATRAALQLLQNEPQHLRTLHQNIRYFRQCGEQAGLPIEQSETAIQPLMVGEDEAALAISAQLLEAGFLVTAIRPPTVPEGTARLRITLSAAHTQDQINRLIETLSGIWRQRS